MLKVIKKQVDCISLYNAHMFLGLKAKEVKCIRKAAVCHRWLGRRIRRSLSLLVRKRPSTL